MADNNNDKIVTDDDNVVVVTMKAEQKENDLVAATSQEGDAAEENVSENDSKREDAVVISKKKGAALINSSSSKQQQQDVVVKSASAESASSQNSDTVEKSHNVPNEDAATMSEFHDEDAEDDIDMAPPRHRPTRRRRRKKLIEEEQDAIVASPETLRKRNALANIAQKAAQWAKDRTTTKRDDFREFDTNSSAKNTATTTSSHHHPSLSPTEIEICEKLDAEYERALEEREVGYSARYKSQRQAAFLSVSIMLLYLTIGTTFYVRQIESMELYQALFFLIYTITTVGYGTMDELPTTKLFQLFTIVYILVGIALLTIMVAQCYQWIALEATRAQHNRDKADLALRGKQMALANNASSNYASPSVSLHEGNDLVFHPNETSACSNRLVDCTFGCFRACRFFFRESPLGRGISVLFPFCGLIGLGAVVVGPIEGWTVVESLYFAVVSLTTVGYGQYVPTKPASIWFSICWLPFSIGFMSMFLSNVAHFYIRLSDKNISRLEQHLRRKLLREKQLAERERAQARKRALRGQRLTRAAQTEIESGSAHDDKEEEEVLPRSNSKSPSKRPRKGFATLPTTGDDDDSFDDDSVVAGAAADPIFGSNEYFPESMGHLRREQVMSKSRFRQVMGNGNDDDQEQQQQTSSMSTMKDVIQTVRENVEAGADSHIGGGGGVESRYMNLNTAARLNSQPSSALFHKKPSFALRVLVQERFAKIIAIDVAGFQSNVEIEDVTLTVTIDSLTDTCDKWLIPRRARKAFRAVAFEALYFVGEHGLITRGADALFDLTPFEFHGILSPLVAAMGDADTMNGWLASTDVLAEVDLKRETSMRQPSPLSYSQRMRISREQKMENGLQPDDLQGDMKLPPAPPLD